MPSNKIEPTSNWRMRLKNVINEAWENYCEEDLRSIKEQQRYGEDETPSLNQVMLDAEMTNAAIAPGAAAVTACEAVMENQICRMK